MFEMLRRWLGHAPALSPETKDPSRQLDGDEPLKPVRDGITAEQFQHSFICREAALGRDERISGYLFTMRQQLSSRMMENSMLIQRVHDEAMLNNIAKLDMPALLGSRHAFVHLSQSSLDSPLLEAISRVNVVIMINAGKLIAGQPQLHAKLLRLREMGIRYGWKIGASHPDIGEFVGEADFVEIEPAGFDVNQLKMVCRQFRALSKDLKLVASGLQSSDEFRLCFHAGFDYFMGPFVSNRENWQPPKSEINRLRVIEVLNMIRRGAEFDAVAEALRTESVLTFKLLRYINSPGLGLLAKISEIPQALMILGRDRFYRWLSLLIFDFDRSGYREHVLNEQVLARARFLEILAGRGHVPFEPDNLFMTGLFSMLNVMMGQPMEDILKQLSLPDMVAATLKGGQGPMRDVMLLAIAVESGTLNEIATAAKRCDLDASVVSKTMIEALAWAQQVSFAGE